MATPEGGENPQGQAQGPEGEIWAQWLVPDKEEVTNITSDDLRVEIRLLARRGESTVTPDVLLRAHERIDDLVRDNKTTIEEAIMWQSRIDSRHQQIVEKEENARGRGELLEAIKPVVGPAVVVVAEEVAEKAGEAIAERIRGRGNRNAGEKKAESGIGEKGGKGVGGRGEGGEGRGEPPKEGEEEPDTFLDLQKRIVSDATPEEERQILMKRREEMMAEAYSAGLFDEIRQTVINKLKYSDWNNVKQNIALLADNLENESHGRHGYDPRWEGMFRAAVIGVSLQISEAGFGKRPFIGEDQDSTWLDRHGMSEATLKRLQKRVGREAFFPLGINPHEFVGAKLAPEPAPAMEELQERLMRGRGIGPIGPIPPNEVVAIFRDSRLGTLEDAWREKVAFLDIRNADERRKWAFLNMEAFSNGIIANPHERWKGTIDFWLTDLRDATRLAKLSIQEKREVRKTELLIKAMMSISASARAMEVSGGNTSIYGNYITQGERGQPNIDRADEWDEFLLHGDSSKLALVVSQPLVRYFYSRLLQDAGYEVPKEWIQDKLVNLTYEEIDRVTFDADRASKGDLIRFLASSGPKFENFKGYEGGGFNAYIEWLLTDEDPGAQEFRKSFPSEEKDPAIIWAAAKLACDAFLVDKFTRWDYGVIDAEKSKTDPNWDNPYRMLKPYIGWGGNPLTALIQPSFLPRVVKKVWTKEDNAILYLVDQAFHPNEMGSMKINPIPASMVGDLKKYLRYTDALWRFFGGARGQAIPAWSRDMMGDEGLPKIADLLDQVYGVRDSVRSKELMGIMMARAIWCKALAVSVESRRPGIKGNLQLLFDPDAKTRPFLEVMQYLWGPEYDARSGFLAALAGGRTRFIFDGNKPAEFAIKDAYRILHSNDQAATGRGTRGTLLNIAGAALDFAQVVSRSGGGRR